MNKPYGIDVSHHQNPASLPWPVFAESSSFCIVRGSYGTMKDRVTLEHLKRARAFGLKTGLYHFYRPSQDPGDQLAVFRLQLDAARIVEGDIVPTIDVEADPLPKPGMHVDLTWQAGVRFMLDALVEQYGDAMVYITQREFGMLGKPAWLLERPLWVAHYTGAAKPATPGNKAAVIWQHRVGPYVPNGAGGYVKERPELDQNRLLGELPLVAARAPFTLPAPPASPAFNEVEDDGLEDLLAEIQGSSWEHTQSIVGSAGQNMLEHERATEAEGNGSEPDKSA